MLSAQLPEKVSKEDASLRNISLQKLAEGDKNTRAELLKACIELGFFYLDCRDYASGLVVDQIQALYSTSVETFDLPQEEKSKWAVEQDHDEHLVLGYKQAGHGNGPVEGKKDGFEAFMLFEHPLSKISHETPFEGPEPLTRKRVLLQESNSSLRDISILILSSLSTALGLPQERGFQNTHRKDAICPTALGLLKYTNYETHPEIVGQIAHTDAGSLSIVFSEVAGLQVLKPKEEQWYYIAPKPGHAVVNVGDALKFISGGALECSLHRVIPHQHEKMRNKYTIVYLLRPEMDAEFEDASGKIWKGVEWTDKKHEIFRAEAEEQAKGVYLTGREGYVGHWDPVNETDAQMITI